MADTSTVTHAMQTPEGGKTPPGEAEEHAPEHAFSDEESDAGGAFADAGAFFALIGVSFRDTAQLVGLETQLACKTILMMVVLAVVLAFVLVGVWLSITLMVAAGLYEYTRLGMTLSIAAASLVNLACAKVLLVTLKRLARRLAFPETRLAVRALLDDASRNTRQDGEK